jgi:hypothetical protein
MLCTVKQTVFEVHFATCIPDQFLDVQYTSDPGKTIIEKIQALTIINKATGWSEFVAIKNKSSQHIALLFDSKWLNLRDYSTVMV